jgi:putative endonuclease
MAEPTPELAWRLYVLRCGDGSLYCGISTDVDRRVAQHQAGTGARYTRGRGPLELLASWPIGSRSAALKAEVLFKGMSRSAKEKLVSVGQPLPWLPA